jgi:hypothetical protein
MVFPMPIENALGPFFLTHPVENLFDGNRSLPFGFNGKLRALRQTPLRSTLPLPSLKAILPIAIPRGKARQSMESCT